ncbi:hypothetical protein HanPI659440_Chr06g0222701 [Helianthus annuus]|nr:hypothetical protein HanPI659440_Chr06g0222701 [Helianthus annuus]
MGQFAYLEEQSGKMGLLCLQKASIFPSRGEGASSDVGQWWYKGQMATTASTLSLGR